MADRDDFQHESLQDTESIAGYLRALIEGFGKGRLELASDDQSLALEPRGLLDLEVRAERRDGRVEVALEIAWREDRSAEPDPTNGLTISTG